VIQRNATTQKQKFVIKSEKVAQNVKKTESICVLGEYARRGQCYNETTHDCVRDRDEFVWSAKVCVKGETLCALKCFNLERNECHKYGDNHILCKKGEIICGGTCYDPKELQCSQNKLCKITEKACNGECYPSTIQKTCFRITYDNSYGAVSKSDVLW